MPSIGNACDADVCAWTTRRVRVEVLGQHRADGALCLRLSLGCSIDRQSRYVGAHGAALFGFEDDRIEHCHSDNCLTQNAIAGLPGTGEPHLVVVGGGA